MASVLAETPQLVEAVLACEPRQFIREAALGAFTDSGVLNHVASLQGGTLYNIVTASLLQFQLSQGEPILEHPIETIEPPKSYIGKVLLGLLSQGHADRSESSENAQTLLAYSHTDICHRAEGHFADSLEKPASGLSRKAFAVIQGGKLSLFGKRFGANTVLVTDTSGIEVEDITIPQGVICGVFDKRKTDMVTVSRVRYIDAENIDVLVPCRISAFAVPKRERLETFGIPLQNGGFGLQYDRGTLLELPDMGQVTASLSGLTHPQEVQKLLDGRKRAIA